LKREEFEASANKEKTQHEGRKFDGEKKPYDGNKNRAPGEKKQFNNREGGSGQFEKKDHRDGAGKKHQAHVAPRRGRDFDKHSAGKTSNKPEDKRGGEGAGNWGNPLDATVVDTTTGGWGDEGQETVTAPVHEEKDVKVDEEKKDGESGKEKREAQPSWDDEGFGKMTLADYEKVASEKAAALAKQVGEIKPRERDLSGVDLTKFVEKDNLEEERYGKKSEKKDKKKATPVARPGEKSVNLTDVFAVGRPGGRGGPRGAPRENRPQQQQQGDRDNKPRGQGRGNRGGEFVHKVPSGTKQFPELKPAVSK